MKRMKNILLLFLMSILLAACAQNMTDHQETSSEAAKTDSSAEAAEEELPESEEEPGAAESGEEENLSSASNKKQVLFVPQKSDIEAGYTTENDTALKELENMILQSSENKLGVENDVAIHFTGLYLENSEVTDAIFVIVNKTDLSMTEIELDISLGTADGEKIFNRHSLILSEEVFGVLEPNTAMPLYVTIEPDKKELLERLVQERNETISLDYFDFEELNSETHNRGGANKGQDSNSPVGKAGASLSAEEEASHSLIFKPQLSEVQQGMTIVNDPVLKDLAHYTNKTDELGDLETLSLHYTGMFFEGVNGTSAVFLLVNPTKTAVSDLTMELSFWDDKGNLLLDHAQLVLTAAEFGVVEPGTVVPVYIQVPPQTLDSFYQITDHHQVVSELHALQFEK